MQADKEVAKEQVATAATASKADAVALSPKRNNNASGDSVGVDSVKPTTAVQPPENVAPVALTTVPTSLPEKNLPNIVLKRVQRFMDDIMNNVSIKWRFWMWLMQLGTLFWIQNVLTCLNGYLDMPTNDMNLFQLVISAGLFLPLMSLVWSLRIAWCMVVVLQLAFTLSVGQEFSSIISKVVLRTLFYLIDHRFGQPPQQQQQPR